MEQPDALNMQILGFLLINFEEQKKMLRNFLFPFL